MDYREHAIEKDSNTGEFIVALDSIEIARAPTLEAAKAIVDALLDQAVLIDRTARDAGKGFEIVGAKPR